MMRSQYADDDRETFVTFRFLEQGKPMKLQEVLPI